MRYNIEIKTENIGPHIPAIAEIYRNAFPAYTSSRLGLTICQRYFTAILEHGAYRIIVVLADGEVAGFATVHVDIMSPLSRKWFFRRPLPIIKLTLRNPLFVLSRINRRLISFYRYKTMQIIASRRKDVGHAVHATCYLHVIAVDKAYRRHGVGRRLVEECVKVGRESNLEKLGLAVVADNTHLIESYGSIGFKVTGRSAAGGLVSLVYDLKD